MSVLEGLGLGSGEVGVTKKKKVKLEGAASLSWVEPLYAEQPSLCWNRSDPITRAAFENAYGLSNQGIPPKRLKFGIHLEESEVDELFGPRVGNNGYSYSYSEDTNFVRRVEMLWMITHQRTQVPITRLINLAEAKGLAYEKKKGKKSVNWCVHAEWTCRDQLWRINQEKDAIKTSVKNVREVSADDQDEESTIAASLDQNVLASSKCRHRSGVELGSGVDVQAMAIGEWEEYLALLERETPPLDAFVSRLSTEKEAAKMEHVRISSQVQYGQTLLKNSSSKLIALQEERERCEEKLAALKSVEPCSSVEIVVASVDMEVVVKKVESQQGFIEQLRESFGSGSTDEEVAALQSQDSHLAWTTGMRKQSLWKLHKVALTEQLKGMKTSYKRPNLHPSPLSFFYVHCETFDVPVVGIEIGVCPFCTKGFDPVWDCRISSCRHAYHTWCAYTHFSRESKCMFEDCCAEPHEDWWVMAGIPKPQRQTTEPPVESWDLCKSVNMGTPFEGRAKRSLSTNVNRPTHFPAHTPSIGSFQTFSRQLELPMDPRCKVLPHTSKRGHEEERDDGLGVGGQISPKCKKLIKHTTNHVFTEEQVFTPTSVENLQQNFINAETLVEGQGVEATIGRGNIHFSRGKSIERGAGKGSRSPKHRRCAVGEDGVEKPSPKRRRGGPKILPVEDIEVTPKDSKKLEEFEEGTDDEESGSDSPRVDGFEDGEHGSEGEEDQRSLAATKITGKKGRAARSGKKPVAERVSVSKVTRAAKGANLK